MRNGGVALCHVPIHYRCPPHYSIPKLHIVLICIGLRQRQDHCCTTILWGPSGPGLSMHSAPMHVLQESKYLANLHGRFNQALALRWISTRMGSADVMKCAQYAGASLSRCEKDASAHDEHCPGRPLCSCGFASARMISELLTAIVSIKCRDNPCKLTTSGAATHAQRPVCRRCCGLSQTCCGVHPTRHQVPPQSC